ncbi:MerR family transcriptional regulator [Streptomyces sp. NPDC054871]
MRIGELAGIVGVTTRAIRHYHHLGLLPEPERRANGYREYGLRHAVVLARIRRLTELGLGLAEVRDVLADDAGRELAEVLAELDADLARQEDAIRERRERLRVLLGDAERGQLSAEGPVSPELGAFFAEMARSTAGREGPESAMAAKDRELLALIDTTAPPEDRDRFMAALHPALSTPDAVERAHEVYALLDALADADLADPRTEAAVEAAVDEAAGALAGALPDSLLEELGTEGVRAVADGLGRGEDRFLEAFFSDFAPAQAEAVRRAMRLLIERGAR